MVELILKYMYDTHIKWNTKYICLPVQKSIFGCISTEADYFHHIPETVAVEAIYIGKYQLIAFPHLDLLKHEYEHKYIHIYYEYLCICTYY